MRSSQIGGLNLSGQGNSLTERIHIRRVSNTSSVSGEGAACSPFRWLPCCVDRSSLVSATVATPFACADDRPHVADVWRPSPSFIRCVPSHRMRTAGRPSSLELGARLAVEPAPPVKPLHRVLQWGHMQPRTPTHDDNRGRIAPDSATDPRERQASGRTDSAASSTPHHAAHPSSIAEYGHLSSEGFTIQIQVLAARVNVFHMH
jgi:hypothetical protein